MADIHLLANNQVLMHIPIPDSNNLVGVNWRDCIVADSGAEAPTSSLADAVDDENPKGWEITAAEKALIASGALVERSIRVPLDKFPGTLLQKKEALLVMVSKNVPNILTRMQVKYKYFGYAGSAA